MEVDAAVGLDVESESVFGSRLPNDLFEATASRRYGTPSKLSDETIRAALTGERGFLTEECSPLFCTVERTTASTGLFQKERSIMARIKRILVAGGAGFLGSHLCGSHRTRRRHLRRQLLYEPEIERVAPPAASEFRADQARRYHPVGFRSRRNLQFSVSCRAQALPI